MGRNVFTRSENGRETNSTVHPIAHRLQKDAEMTRLEQNFEDVMRENDLIKHQRGEIMTALKIMSCDPNLDPAQVLRISDLVQKVSSLRS